MNKKTKMKTITNALKKTAILGLTLASLIVGAGCSNQSQVEKDTKQDPISEYSVKMPEECRKYGFISAGYTDRYQNYFEILCKDKNNGFVIYDYKTNIFKEITENYDIIRGEN